MYRPVLVTPPVITPITLAEAKANLDIGYVEKDELITGLIAAATSYLDGWTGILGRALCEQTWRQDFDEFRSCLRLPLSPVISIASVKYTDTSGVEQTVAESDYALRCDELGSYVEFAGGYSFPPLNSTRAAVRVEYVAGYVDTPAVEADEAANPTVAAVPRRSTVPDAIKQAMHLMIRQWFDNPSAVAVGVAVAKMPFAVDALLALFRRNRF